MGSKQLWIVCSSPPSLHYEWGHTRFMCCLFGSGACTVSSSKIRRLTVFIHKFPTCNFCTIESLALLPMAFFSREESQ